LSERHKFSISGTALSSYYHDQFTAKFVPYQSCLRVQSDVGDNISKLGPALSTAPAGMLTACWGRQFDSLTYRSTSYCHYVHSQHPACIVAKTVQSLWPFDDQRSALKYSVLRLFSNTQTQLEVLPELAIEDPPRPLTSSALRFRCPLSCCTT